MITKPAANATSCPLPPRCAACGTYGGKPGTNNTRPQRSDGEPWGYGPGATLCRRCVTLEIGAKRKRDAANGGAVKPKDQAEIQWKRYVAACEERLALLSTLKAIRCGERVPESVLRRVFRRPTKRDERISDLA